MMRNCNRKCVKCNASTAQDSELVLHRFPKPGPSNAQRLEAWAKFCYPEGNWNSVDFQRSLFSSHKMLCSKHFPESAFVQDHLQRKKLHRYSIPSELPSTSTHSSEVEMSIAVNEPSQQAGTARAFDSIDSSDYSHLEPPGTSKAVTSTAEIIQTPNLSGAKSIEKSKREKRLLNKCRRNLRKICSLQKKIKKLKTQKILETLIEDDAVQEMSTDLTSSFAVLLQGQLLNCKRKKKGRRWNLHQKILSLRLFKRSPATYRLLRRLFFLPSQTTLKNLLNKLPLKPGINYHLFDVVKKVAANNIPLDNEYSLLFDEMSIRKNLNYNSKSDQIDGFQDHGREHGRDAQIASHALVFMILSVRKRVKQPVAYYLSGDHVTADRLMILIKEVLHACFDAGITIAATICDMDGVNRRALSQLGASIEEPYFRFQEHEIVALHDTPHLLKCFRNLFLKYDIKCNTNVECNGKQIADIAKWKHIENFFKLDNNNPFFVFAPALTKSHLNPNNKQKMKVKLAAQVLSHTVSAGMYAKITQGELPTEALATVNLLNKIDQLFDSLNADTPSLKKGKKYLRNISDRSPHFTYYKEMKLFFKNCQFIGAKSRAPSLDGWIQTMVGVERIWRNFKQKYPEIGSLSTRRLQQDALENCFGCIRSNCGSNCNPTVSQFVAALKTGIISNLSAPSSAANCETDNDVILDNLNLFLTHNAKPDVDQHSTSVRNEADCCSLSMDQMDENTGEIQACAYVCGYIIKRMKTNCESCLQCLTSSTETTCHLFTIFKEYEHDKKSLKYANIKMIECVNKSVSIMCDYLNTNAHMSRVKDRVKELLQKNMNFDFLDVCSEHKELNVTNLINSIFYISINRFCNVQNRIFSESAAQASLQKKINILKHK